jgi:hypothetical protein
MIDRMALSHVLANILEGRKFSPDDINLRRF